MLTSKFEKSGGPSVGFPHISYINVFFILQTLTSHGTYTLYYVFLHYCAGAFFPEMLLVSRVCSNKFSNRHLLQVLVQSRIAAGC